MRKIFFALILLLCLQHLSFAQMDNKFYYPDKNWVNIDSVNYTTLDLYIDADTIHTIIVKPTKLVKATIIYFHGNGGNISKWLAHIKPLLNNGFQVCMFDYRGYGKSTGTPTHLNIADDARIWLDTLLKRDDINNNPIIIYGASIGSQVATHMARKYNDKVTALVLDGMMASFTDVALATSPKEAHDMIRQYVTSPYSVKEDITHLNNTKVLFIHSEEDFIPIGQVKEIYNNLKGTKTFWEYIGKHIEAPLKYPDVFVEYINNLL